jgi:hypothetical protein
MPGIDTSAVEVTHISANAIWILIDDEEFALPYAEFPWFRNATVDQILTGVPLVIAGLAACVRYEGLSTPDHIQGSNQPANRDHFCDQDA